MTKTKIFASDIRNKLDNFVIETELASDRIYYGTGPGEYKLKQLVRKTQIIWDILQFTEVTEFEILIDSTVEFATGDLNWAIEKWDEIN